MDDADRGWFDDWLHGEPLPPPTAWGKPGMALAFNLACAGCVGRAVPWLKRLAPRVGDRAVLLAIHTAYGHEVWPREGVAPQVTRYAAEYAALPFPLALDLDGGWAQANGAQGTPHWFVWDEQGRLERSVYGSQENAITRLGYVVEAWGVEPPG
jgi:hypothetical protein